MYSHLGRAARREREGAVRAAVCELVLDAGDLALLAGEVRGEEGELLAVRRRGV